jgi:hypothetical protein
MSRFEELGFKVKIFICGEGYLPFKAVRMNDK